MKKVKRRNFFFASVALFLVAAVSRPSQGLIYKFLRKIFVKHRMLITKEPLRIGFDDPNGKVYYTLPPKTKMYNIESVEGRHDLYSVFFFHQGPLLSEAVLDGDNSLGSLTNPLKLSDIAKEDLEQRFKWSIPISREHIISAVKAKKISKADLIDIYNTFSKEPYHKD